MSGRVLVFPDSGALCAEAASIFLELAKSGTGAGRPFSFVISGGSTPLPLFRLLASGGYHDAIDWRLVHFFWADERCVPPDHEDSNYGAAYRLMLSKLPLPPSNIHRIKGELEPGDAAHEYEDEIKAYFSENSRDGFDLVFLGVGEDGHTASLFPGSDLLNEGDWLVVPADAVHAAHTRVTLTLPAINSSANVAFLVSGINKARIVSEVINDATRARYPAGLVGPVKGELIWLLDRDAASKL